RVGSTRPGSWCETFPSGRGWAKLHRPAFIAAVLIVTMCVCWGGKGWAAPGSRPSSVEEKYLGIRGKTYHEEVRGVKVLQVLPGSPAAKAGLRSDHDPVPGYLSRSGGAAGHIIVRADRQPIRAEEDLQSFLTHRSPGDVVKFLVTVADGTFYEMVTVTLAGAPQTASLQSPTEKKLASPPLQEETLDEGQATTVLAVPPSEEEKQVSPLPPQEAPQLSDRLSPESRDESGFVSRLGKVKAWLAGQREGITGV